VARSKKFTALTLKNIVTWDVTNCTLLYTLDWCFAQFYGLSEILAGRLAGWLVAAACSTTLQKVSCSFETSVHLYRTTWRHITLI